MRRCALFSLLAATAVLTACGDDASTTGASSTPSTTTSSSVTPATPASGAHNEGDAMYAQRMIPHHAQAVVMADAALTRAENPQVRDLARNIKDAQQPEIDQMTGWLRGWGEPTQLPSSGEHGEHGGAMMPGMMSDSEMASMAKASGREFDRMFLQMMVTHHDGAIQMSASELADGTNPDARALATHIKTTQQQEIDQMKQLLKELA